MKQQGIREGTDPYGRLEYTIGTEDDFWCFDYDYDPHGSWIVLHATINSESASFIEDILPPTSFEATEAHAAALKLVKDAREWCHQEPTMGFVELPHDQEFPRAVWRAVEAMREAGNLTHSKG